MKLNRIERWFVNSPMRRAMQSLVVRWFRGIRPLPAGADILEIGCGSGVGARMIAEQFAPRRLFLSDLDPRMVALAAGTVSRGAAASTGFCVADVEALPFRSRAADAVFGFGFLHHVPDWRRGLREIHRVLKPHAVYYFEEYYPSLYQNVVTRRLAAHPPHDRFRSRELRREFETVGLELRQTFELKRFGILGVGVKKGRNP
jgi:ubiquinone/menaquinone biosynthesis C-methylase UbiE